MRFSLIICTYKRPDSLIKLLGSVQEQVCYPNEILVIDGSPDKTTRERLELKVYRNLLYFQVEEKDRGLTRQRNYGISKVSEDIEIVCFLDDDVVLEPDFFEKINRTYLNYPEAIGVGGYILNEVFWREGKKNNLKFEDFEFDGWIRKLGSRNLLRKRFGLLSKERPGVMPVFSHGLSISFLPPSGKTYPVEFFMGGVASYRKELLEKIRFSKYFEGYGLYEDMDFCLRASRRGQLYVNTSAGLYHHHNEGGRPNKFKYGKMVIRNGWFVWRTKYPSPNLNAKLKWHGISFLLTLVRVGNGFTTNKKKEAFSESAGRVVGWLSVLTNPPKIER